MKWIFMFFVVRFLNCLVLSKWSHLILWHWFTVGNHFGVMVLSVSSFTICHHPSPFQQHAFHHKGVYYPVKNILFVNAFKPLPIHFMFLVSYTCGEMFLKIKVIIKTKVAFRYKSGSCAQWLDTRILSWSRLNWKFEVKECHTQMSFFSALPIQKEGCFFAMLSTSIHKIMGFIFRAIMKPLLYERLYEIFPQIG